MLLICNYIDSTGRVCGKAVHDSSTDKCIFHCLKDNWFRYVRDVNNNIIGKSWRKAFKKGWIRSFWAELKRNNDTAPEGSVLPVREDYKLDFESGSKEQERYLQVTKQ